MTTVLKSLPECINAIERLLNAPINLDYGENGAKIEALFEITISFLFSTFQSTEQKLEFMGVIHETCMVVEDSVPENSILYIEYLIEQFRVGLPLEEAVLSCLIGIRDDFNKALDYAMMTWSMCRDMSGVSLSP